MFNSIYMTYMYDLKCFRSYPPPHLPPSLPPPTSPPPHPTPTPSNTPPSTHLLCAIQDIHDKVVRSFQNRHIYPLKGCIVSTHRLSCPARPAPRFLHDQLVHSFQNRQIYPVEGFIVSTHKMSCPTPHVLENSALPSPVIRLTVHLIS